MAQDALEFEVVYFVLNPSYGVFMDTQQRVLTATMKLVDEVGASDSRPSQRVLVDSADDDKEDKSSRTLRYLKK